MKRFTAVLAMMMIAVVAAFARVDVQGKTGSLATVQKDGKTITWQQFGSYLSKDKILADEELRIYLDGQYIETTNVRAFMAALYLNSLSGSASNLMLLYMIEQGMSEL